MNKNTLAHRAHTDGSAPKAKSASKAKYTPKAKSAARTLFTPEAQSALESKLAVGFVSETQSVSKPKFAPKAKPAARPTFTPEKQSASEPKFASEAQFASKPKIASRTKPATRAKFTPRDQAASETKFNSGDRFARKPKFASKPRFETESQTPKRPVTAQRTSSAPAPRIATQPQPQFLNNVFGSLIPDLQRAVAAEGYEIPTPIQEQCIPHLLEDRDLLGCAQTGTGKTAAFTLPLLQRLSRTSQRPKKGTPRALILAPTRELAAQISDSIQTYGRFLPLTNTVVFGGVNQFQQVRALNRGIDILVATPGRLLDLMQQGYIHLNEVEVFILDEVDRMLDMGFIPDINRILSHIPEERQTLFFSATLPPKMELIARSMVTDPMRVSITPDKLEVDRITQKVLFVGKENKDALLISLLSDPLVSKAIIFTQMKHAANRVVKRLNAAGIRGDAIHGNKSQAARTKALNGFKRGQFQVLVATDVAARGLDVDDITHVINYDLPVEAETYVHRIGRTARAGAEGNAISFCSAEDRSYLREIERLLGNPVPTEMKHAYHCEKAFRSSQPAPKTPGGGTGKRQDRRAQGQGQFGRNRNSRSRNHNRSER